jgi:hypothetical protein
MVCCLYGTVSTSLRGGELKKKKATCHDMRSDTYRYYNKRLSIRLKLSIMRRLVISETCNWLRTTQQLVIPILAFHEKTRCPYQLTFSKHATDRVYPATGLLHIRVFISELVTHSQGRNTCHMYICIWRKVHLENLTLSQSHMKLSVF